MARIFQDGRRLVVFIFIIARQRSSDGRQVRLIGTRPKASRAIEFTINRPTTNALCRLCLEKKKFVSCNGLKKNRVGPKCVFYACFMLIGSREGRKNFRVGIFLNYNLLG